MDEKATVLYEKLDAVAYVTLNRPKALNAFNVRMRDELYEVMWAVKSDSEVRVAVIRGAGDRAFCAGADLSEFISAPSAVKARDTRALRDLWKLFLSVPQPLVAAMHGFVIGSGLELSQLCDIRIAATNAVFRLPEVSLGIMPAAGGTQTVPRSVGISLALDMLLTNRTIGADEALRHGLVSRVVQPEMMQAATDEVALRLASFEPLAVRNAKQAVRSGADLALAEGLHLERLLSLELAAARIPGSGHNTPVELQER